MAINASSLNASSRAEKKLVDLQQVDSLSFRSISKRFGAVQANDSISFDVASGGIHAIVGENGAGKSTLTKILCGHYQPDSGSIYVDGRQIVFNSPAQARRLGIGMVHQQLALVPSMSGYENVLLGDPRVAFQIPKRELEKQIATKARELGFEFDLDFPVSNLAVADRQKLEIFKLLWRDSKVLILDEPTSQLTPFEADDVLKLASDLAAAGRIVILITHHISEVMQFAKRVTVLRKGRCIVTLDASEVHAGELAKHMVDFDGSLLLRTARPEEGIPLLSLKGVNTTASDKQRALHDIDLNIYAGEILGIAGITGTGQMELGMLTSGLLQPTTGTLAWDGKAITSLPGEWVSYIPSEQKYACAFTLSIAKNSFLKKANDPASYKFGFLKHSMMNDYAEDIISAFDVRPPLPDVPCKALSGGNLQRMIIGRELMTDSRLVVVDNPSAGLDANMAMRVRQELRKAADNGRAVVLISPDMEELITVCDRIVVMFNGRINGHQQAGQFDSQSLGLLMGGVDPEIVDIIRSQSGREASAGTSKDALSDERVSGAIAMLSNSPHAWQRRLANMIEQKVSTGN